jgi:hypothetical protein
MPIDAPYKQLRIRLIEIEYWFGPITFGGLYGLAPKTRLHQKSRSCTKTF